MSWFRQLDRHRGSRPRCVLMVEGSREEVANRFTQLVNLPDVTVSSSDVWIPYGKPRWEDGSWDIKPSHEAILSKPNTLVAPLIQAQLRTWWLAVSRGANAPNWDIATTCSIKGEPGLLLIEAKAHGKELSEAGKPRPKSSNGWKNHERIGLVIAEASEHFQIATGECWDLSRDHHYQLSNRFAWSWKLASLGIPVILLYLGFLNAQEMAADGPLFRTESEWTRTLRAHSRGTVAEMCWGEWMDFSSVPLIASTRGVYQSFNYDYETSS